MAKAEILAPDDPNYQKDVQALVALARTLAANFGKLVSEMVDFAEKFNSVSQQAQNMDKVDNGDRYDKLCDELSKAVGSSNPSIWSRWNTIASQAKQLRRYATALPPYRDSLYEVALTLKDKPAVVEKWIRRAELTPETPVNKIKSLRVGKKKSKKAKAQKQASGKGFPAAITLYFKEYEAAFKFLHETMSDHPEFRIGTDKALEAQFQTLDEKELAKANKRFI